MVADNESEKHFVFWFYENNWIGQFTTLEEFNEYVDEYTQEWVFNTENEARGFKTGLKVASDCLSKFFDNEIILCCGDSKQEVTYQTTKSYKRKYK